MTYSKAQSLRKANNLCIDCGLPVKKRVRCQTCSIKAIKATAVIRKHRKKNNLCYTCGGEPAKNRTRCRDCAAKGVQSVQRMHIQRQKKGLCRCGEQATIGLVCKTCWFKITSNNNTGTRANWEAIKKILEDQQYRCVYTNEKLIPGKNASLDHIIPKIKGGTNDVDNLQWTTLFVNTRMKYHFTHSEFMLFIENILKNNKKRMDRLGKDFQSLALEATDL